MSPNGAGHTYYRDYNILLLRSQILFSDDLESHLSHFLSDNLEYSRQISIVQFPLLNFLLIYAFLIDYKEEARATDYNKSSGLWHTEINSNPSILMRTELSSNVLCSKRQWFWSHFTPKTSNLAEKGFTHFPIKSILKRSRAFERWRKSLHALYHLFVNKEAISLP